MERKEALKIAKLAYKEICETIEESITDLEEYHGVSVLVDVPGVIAVDRHKFISAELEE